MSEQELQKLLARLRFATLVKDSDRCRICFKETLTLALIQNLWHAPLCQEHATKDHVVQLLKIVRLH